MRELICMNPKYDSDNQTSNQKVLNLTPTYCVDGLHPSHKHAPASNKNLSFL